MWISIGLLRRQLNQVQTESSLSLPEAAAMATLERGGPATAAEPARAEQISPQSEFSADELRQLRSIAPLILRLAPRVSDRTDGRVSNRGR